MLGLRLKYWDLIQMLFFAISKNPNFQLSQKKKLILNLFYNLTLKCTLYRVNRYATQDQNFYFKLRRDHRKFPLSAAPMSR